MREALKTVRSSHRSRPRCNRGKTIIEEEATEAIESITDAGPIQEGAGAGESSEAVDILVEKPKIDEVIIEADVAMAEVGEERSKCSCRKTNDFWGQRLYG